MGQHSRRMVSTPWLVAALILPIPVFFTELGALSFWDPDEGRHAEIARAMLSARDWLLPHLNLNPYFEKLPTFYWVIAACFQAFGLNEWSARLPSSIFSLLGVWLTIRWGIRHLGEGTGILAGVILTTMAGYVGAARLASPETTYAVTISMGLFAVSHALLANDSRKMIVPYLWLAVATAVRGPIAIVLAIMIIAPLGMRHTAREQLRPARGALIISALVLPILAGCIWRDPHYLWAFLIDTNLGSFIGTIGGRDVSLFYYAWMLPLLMLPWSVFLPSVIIDQTRSRTGEAQEVHRFLSWWVLVIIVVFSASQTKMPGYMLPALPPLALLTAHWATTRIRLPLRFRFQDPLLSMGAAICALFLLAPWLGQQILERFAPPYAEQWVYLLWLIPIAAPGVAAVVLGNRPGVLAWIASSSAVIILAGYIFGSEPVSQFNSLKAPAQLIAQEMPPKSRLLSYSSEGHSLSFYSRRPVLDVANPQTVGLILDGDAPVGLLTKTRHLEKIRQSVRRPLYVWWQGESRKVLLANRPRREGPTTRIILPKPTQHAGSTAWKQFKNPTTGVR